MGGGREKQHVKTWTSNGGGNWKCSCKNDDNINLLVIICVRLLQKFGMHNLTNLTQFKKVNGSKQLMTITHNYCRIHIIIHARILLLRAQKCWPPGVVQDKYDRHQTNYILKPSVQESNYNVKYQFIVHFQFIAHYHQKVI